MTESPRISLQISYEAGLIEKDSSHQANLLRLTERLIQLAGMVVKKGTLKAKEVVLCTFGFCEREGTLALTGTIQICQPMIGGQHVNLGAENQAHVLVQTGGFYHITIVSPYEFDAHAIQFGSDPSTQTDMEDASQKIARGLFLGQYE